MRKTVAKKRYTARDMRAVSDNPEWTKDDFVRAKTFDEVFPTMRKGRGPNRAPTKQQVTLRLSPDVVDYFKAEGPGWQSRIDETLVKIVKRKRSSDTG
ncbi:BrnA antitoxin family protein [Bradyrhizobium manausense]|uniref:BrnA antitoxin family protein n=1 Tax=Bradyrhizobium manausense TaxID=989370 RepID=UPI001BA444D7|nr:BrnA antitoxin family protein [Bradyrhizobium manausense]MBR1087300.1 BrnA antitoxin family protein [Bradyrhizobium manausense]